MATSTFGKRTAFKPTPSTCYPPPPPPPLPYDVPCLRGAPGFRLKQRGRIRIIISIGPPIISYLPSYEGLPVKGSKNGNDTFTLNISSPQFVTLTTVLSCEPDGPMIRAWFFVMDGIAIMPDGTFIAFSNINRPERPNDLSQPNGYQDIRQTSILGGGPQPVAYPDEATTQWFTAGAPVFDPMS